MATRSTRAGSKPFWVVRRAGVCDDVSFPVEPNGSYIYGADRNCAGMTATRRYRDWLFTTKLGLLFNQPKRVRVWTVEDPKGDHLVYLDGDRAVGIKRISEERTTILCRKAFEHLTGRKVRAGLDVRVRFEGRILRKGQR